MARGPVVYLAMMYGHPASLCSGVGMQMQRCSLFPRLPFPLSHIRQEQTLSIGPIRMHKITVAVLCVRAAVGLPSDLRIRVVFLFIAAPRKWGGVSGGRVRESRGHERRGPGHHDAMTEAPGRKNDAHLAAASAMGPAAKFLCGTRDQSADIYDGWQSQPTSKWLITGSAA